MKRMPLMGETACRVDRYHIDLNDLRGVHIAEYQAGEMICVQGQPLDSLLIVVSGRAKVCLFVENGRSLLLCFYNEGGIIGDLELMAGDDAAQTSVQAASDLTVIAIPIVVNRELLMTGNTFLRSMGAALAQKLKRSSRNGAYNMLYPIESRLCSYIELVHRDGMFDERLTEVAELLGVSYRHLLRALGALVRDGILAKGARGYALTDRKRLHERGHGFYLPIER